MLALSGQNSEAKRTNRVVDVDLIETFLSEQMVHQYTDHRVKIGKVGSCHTMLLILVLTVVQHSARWRSLALNLLGHSI
jgi:hypothetical protein